MADTDDTFPTSQHVTFCAALAVKTLQAAIADHQQRSAA
jgi:hypothetical protein